MNLLINSNEISHFSWLVICFGKNFINKREGSKYIKKRGASTLNYLTQ